MKTTTRMGAIALALCTYTGIALADVSGAYVQSYSKAVKYSPAEVQTSEGAQALYSKLQVAAMDVCGASAPTRLYERWAVQQCAVDAVTKAVQDVNSPTLDAIHKLRRGSVEVVARR